MILGFLPVEEEGYVQPVLGQRDGGGNGNGDALVGGAVEHAPPAADFVEVGFGVELPQSGDLAAGLDFSGIDEVGDFPAGLGGEVAEFQDIGVPQKINEFLFVAFHR